MSYMRPSAPEMNMGRRFFSCREQLRTPTSQSGLSLVYQADSANPPDNMGHVFERSRNSSMRNGV
jgi:hypothetical protein